MRIEDFSPKETSIAPMQDKTSRNSVSSGARSSSDLVALSNLSCTLTRSSGGAVRVQDLRLALETGTYKVDADRVSKHIVDFYLQSAEYLFA